MPNKTNEAQLRLMLAQTLQCSAVQCSAENSAPDLPRQQNRRTLLNEAALLPAKNQFTRGNLNGLSKAAALTIVPKRWMLIMVATGKENAHPLFTK
ncbi:MAG: hypothetical protein QM709_07725 [Spongiibacteraceae bacterium]